MGVFGAVCRRSGDGGFSGALLWVSGGVVGFNVAMLSRLVRDILRAARPCVGASAKKFALRAHNGQQLAFDGALGELFRGPAVVGSRWASYFADQQSWDPAGRVCCAVRLAAGPVY